MFNRSFYFLWGSQTLSNTADLFYMLSLTILVLEKTNSIIFTTLVPFFTVMSRLLSSFFAPLLIVRFRLTFLLMISQIGQFVFFVTLALYISPWVYGYNLIIVFILVFLISFLDGWTTPARNALVPRLVESKGLMRANGIMGTSDQVVQFAGWALGGVLVSIIGSVGMLYLVMVFFGLALASTALIQDPTDPVQHNIWGFRLSKNDKKSIKDSMNMSSRHTHWQVLKEGWVLLWKSQQLRALTFMDVTAQLGASVWTGAFMLVFVQDVLHKGEQWWGYINASYFAGAILGGLVIVTIVNKLENYIVSAMLIGTLGYVMITTLYALNTSAIFSMLIVFFTGPMTELAAVSRRTLLQRSVDKELLPKVFSAQDSLLSTIYGMSLLIMSSVADIFGIVTVYLLAAIISGFAVIVGWINRRSLNFSNTNKEKVETTSF